MLRDLKMKKHGMQQHHRIIIITILILQIPAIASIETLKLTLANEQAAVMSDWFCPLTLKGYDCNLKTICIESYEKCALFTIGDSVRINHFRGYIDSVNICKSDSNYVILSYENGQTPVEIIDDSVFYYIPNRNVGYELSNSWIIMDSISQSKMFLHVNNILNEPVKKYTENLDTIIIKGDTVTQFKASVYYLYKIYGASDISCHDNVNLTPNVPVVNESFYLGDIAESVDLYCDVLFSMNVTGVIRPTCIYLSVQSNSGMNGDITISRIHIDSTSFKSIPVILSADDTYYMKNENLTLKIDWIFEPSIGSNSRVPSFH